MAKRKNKTRNSLFALSLILAVVIAVNFYVFLSTRNILEVRYIDARVIVSNGSGVGFDLNTSALTFGKIMIGGGSNRIISFDNRYDFPILVYISGKGGMSGFVVPQVHRIEGGEKSEIVVSAVVPNGARFGAYTGKVEVVIKKVLQ